MLVQTSRFFLIILSAVFVTACSDLLAPTATSPKPTVFPTRTIPGQPVTVPTLTILPPTPSRLSCQDWPSWPVTPTVSEAMRALYQRGQSGGNNPRAFSKIGDGEISADWFFTMFDLSQNYYDLGPYQDLVLVIENFHGSFGRTGVAARRGFNTVRILEPASGDPNFCEAYESPLSCEVRLHRPAFAILSLGTNQVWRPEEFEQGMRQILDMLLSQNIVPILSTKGDNLEGDQRINQTIACLAEEYELPLWNFWAAIQPLPNHGLQPDLEHLTYGITDFDDERAMQSAWTIRNLTALQALDVVWRGITTQP